MNTRAIVERAQVSQGLLIYHFKSKEALWRAAADHLFAMDNDAFEYMDYSLKIARLSSFQFRTLLYQDSSYIVIIDQSASPIADFN